MGFGMLSSKYSTSVLYDFDFVMKGVFYVFEKKMKETTVMALLANKKADLPMGQCPFSYTKKNESPIYLQINPATIRAETKPDRAGMDLGEGTFWVNTNPREYRDTLTLDVRFDLYDEYMLGTGDGLFSFSNSRDLVSRKGVALRRLMELSRSLDEVVYFKWGPIEYFGSVQEVDCTYTAFSKYGNPLKAEGSITLKREGTIWKENGVAEYWEDQDDHLNFFELASIEGDQLADKVLVKAETAIQQALR